MPNMTGFEPPEATAFSAHFQELVLEKVRYQLRDYISPVLLEEIKMRPDFSAGRIADNIAYRIEGYFYGREVSERVVDRSVVKEKEEKQTPEIKSVSKTETVPVTWWDHAKLTWATYASLKHGRVADWISDMHDDDDAPAPLRWHLARMVTWPWRGIWWFLWKHVHSKTRTIEKTVTNVRNVTVTPITKNIEVHKHWHTCPHLSIKTDRPHIEYLMQETPFQ